MSNLGNMSTELSNGGGVVLFESDFDNGLGLTSQIKLNDNINNFESIVLYLYNSTATVGYKLQCVPGLNVKKPNKCIASGIDSVILNNGTDNCAIDLFTVELTIVGSNDTLARGALSVSRVLFKSDGTFTITKYDTSAWRVCKVIGYKK